MNIAIKEECNYCPPRCKVLELSLEKALLSGSGNLEGLTIDQGDNSYWTIL